MAIYVITGGTTGIGAVTKAKLQAKGHEVFNIDYKNGDFTADLSKPQERQAAISEVYKRYPDGIDVLICNAGVGPTAPIATIFAVNFFAAIRIAEGLRPLLKKKHGNCVVTSSNSITNSTVRQDFVDMLTGIADENDMVQIVKEIDPRLAASCYSSSKRALARWVRRVSPFWASEGMRINTVAPGNTITPLVKALTKEQQEATYLIPIPIYYGTHKLLEPEEIANGIIFLASPEASGINGSVLFIDGGIDALLRSEQI